MDLFEYLFIFCLRRYLLAKQALNSKQSAKGYERIIQEILRSGFCDDSVQSRAKYSNTAYLFHLLAVLVQ